MRGLVLVALVTLSLATAAAPFAAPQSTSLRVTYWADPGKNLVPTYVWTLRCDPAGGTLQSPARACRKLARGRRALFAPLPKNIVCTEIYGGPQKARVVGTVDGRRIWATFTRANGCNIDRWQRVSPWLLPPGGIT